MRKTHTSSDFLRLLPLAVLFLTTLACNLPSLNPPPTATLAPSSTPTSTNTASLTPTDSATATPLPTSTSTATSTSTNTPVPTPTETPSPSNTPLPTATPSETPTPTPNPRKGIVKVGQGFCRYGPSKAYLHAHGLVQGDEVSVDGRDNSGYWLWVQPAALTWHCWSAASNFELNTDPKSIPVQPVVLPKSTFVQKPSGVWASRDGSTVEIHWDAANYIPVGDRRGYLLELWLCQNGAYFWGAYQTDKTSFKIQDDKSGCSGPSSGLLYIAEKHGYSDPVTIPWP